MVDPARPDPDLAFFRQVCGARGVVTDLADQSDYLREPRGRFTGVARAVVLPGSTAEVAAVVQYAHAHGIAIVPQGGQTGLCGGAMPDDTGRQVILNLKRMRRILAFDSAEGTVTVQAGCRLAELQQAAASNGWWFPLSLASSGDCQIGGNLATNAGGHNVLRYGNVRELCRGLEVVLADGRVWSDLKGLAKDNSGYDLKQLFIGAEGTLGIITAAVLRLVPQPAQQALMLVPLPDVATALQLFGHLNAAFGEAVTAFELMSAFSVDLVARYFPDLPVPRMNGSPWCVLIELSRTSAGTDLTSELAGVLDASAGGEGLRDAVMAADRRQMDRLWAVRNAIPDAQRCEGPSIKHDISLPRERMAPFIAEVLPLLQACCPGVRPCIFGHLGDGNLHFNLSAPTDGDAAAFLTQRAGLERLVHDRVVAHGGSFAAEHGVGQLKRGEMARYKDAVTLDLMQRVKRALDPQGILNPGKVLPEW
ncbi:MAG: FAD-binding oxidoreductase [Pseudomonadota bacterium]